MRGPSGQVWSIDNDAKVSQTSQSPPPPAMQTYGPYPTFLLRSPPPGCLRAEFPPPPAAPAPAWPLEISSRRSTRCVWVQAGRPTGRCWPRTTSPCCCCCCWGGGSDACWAPTTALLLLLVGMVLRKVNSGLIRRTPLLSTSDILTD